MLIPSPRHTAADLALWAELEAADRLVRPPDPAAAVAAIRGFAAAGACYCGVSWGKDSVVVAHLCRLAAPRVPLVHLRPTNHNPDCDAVRDAYFAAFPGQPYSEWPVDYSDLHARGLPHQQLDRETDRRWFAAIRESGRPFAGRHVLGVRSEESAGRRARERVWGENSPNGCAPITRWTTAGVFAHLAAYGLPVHPAYAMLGGGRWPRDRLRVAEVGDTHGTGGGRAEWEREYYGDVLRRLEAGAT